MLHFAYYVTLKGNISELHDMLSSTNKRLYTFLFASSLGTFLEFFDLALFSFASALIAKHFFPAGEPIVAVLATWGIFAVSYLMRPLGAIWFGHLADSKSSKRAMVISMSMMSVATTAIGLLPTYATIGIWAPIILLLLRIMQSVAVSPEYNLPSVFIKNNQWCAKHFGLVSSLSACVTGLGMMSASWIMSRTLANFTLAEMTGYEWRVPFVIAGILVGTIGIYLRWNLDESLLVKAPKTVPLKLVLREQRKDFFQAAFIAGYIGCMSYALFGFLVHQLQVIKLMNPGEALRVLGHGSLLPASFSLIAGFLSDRIPRNRLMLCSAIVMGLSGYYLFAYLHNAELSSTVTCTCIMLASLGFFAGSFPGYLADLFAQEYRYTGAFLAYNIGMSWIGGMSPLLLISLSKINFMLPPAIILLYSTVVVLLVAKPLVTFAARSPKMV
jgi:MHS family proline/betaine transporter-like MFS transporter